MKRWRPPMPGERLVSNRYALLPPSQRLIVAARKAGVQGGKHAIDAWATATNWTGIKRHG